VCRMNDADCRRCDAAAVGELISRNVSVIRNCDETEMRGDKRCVLKTNVAGRVMGTLGWASLRFSFHSETHLLSMSLFIDCLTRSNLPATSSLARDYQILSTGV